MTVLCGKCMRNRLSGFRAWAWSRESIGLPAVPGKKCGKRWICRWMPFCWFRSENWTATRTIGWLFRQWHVCRSCRYTIYYAGRVRKQNFCRSLPRVYTSLIGCGFWDIGRMSVICCTLQIFSVSHPNGKGWAWQHWRQWKLVCRWSLPIFMAFGTIPSAVKRDLPAQYRMWRNLPMRLKRSPKTATSGNEWGHIISRQ